MEQLIYKSKNLAKYTFLAVIFGIVPPLMIYFLNNDFPLFFDNLISITFPILAGLYSFFWIIETKNLKHAEKNDLIYKSQLKNQGSETSPVITGAIENEIDNIQIIIHNLKAEIDQSNFIIRVVVIFTAFFKLISEMVHTVIEMNIKFH